MSGEAPLVRVPSQGGVPPDEETAKKALADAEAGADQQRLVELSEEDRKLRDALESAVAVLKTGTGDVNHALTVLGDELRTATSSMTSVPKPLKFLYPHFDALTQVHTAWQDGATKAHLADVISVMALSRTTNGKRDTLRYKLRGNRFELDKWGQEYVRCIAGEIGQAYGEQLKAGDAAAPGEFSQSDLLAMVSAVVPLLFSHNSEPEAIDVLMETQQLHQLLDTPVVDRTNFKRVCLYLLRCADYLADLEERTAMLKIVQSLFKAQQQFPDAMRVALRLNDLEAVSALVTGCDDRAVQKQMAAILGDHRANVTTGDAELDELIGNNHLSKHFAILARDLDVMEPKTPEDIYKSHLADTGSTARNNNKAPADSARGNLASSFVNGFVNAGYGSDKLLLPTDSQWVFKNRGHGTLSTVASLGMVLQWDPDRLTDIDKYLEMDDPQAKAGAILALGLCCTGIRSEVDAVLSLVSDYVAEGSSHPTAIKAAAILALGFAYAGSERVDIMELLTPYVASMESGLNELGCLAGLALGLVFVGTGNKDVAAVLADRVMECSLTAPEMLDHALVKHLALGLGLVHLGKGEDSTIMSVVQAVEHPIARFLAVLLSACSFAGSGEVLQVQKMLHMCAEHPATPAAVVDPAAAASEEAKDTKDPKNEPTPASCLYQSAAVLGIGLITMGEELGVDMTTRTVEHLLQFGDPAVRRAVPLAIALHRVSDPQFTVVDTLSKLSHDSDPFVSQNAILAMGIVGAGSNNSRIAGLLRQLVVFHQRQADHLFVVRIAQGLLHMGKGLLSMSPFHSDRFLLNRVALAGLLGVLTCGLDLTGTVHGQYHYLLYCAAAAAHPRMLLTVDEDLKPLPVDVRVGQAVDTVGQAGQPKTITGFQTHTTPVLLGVTDRAELASEEYVPLTSVLEGLVILRRNPDFVPATSTSAAGAAAGSSSSK